MRGPWPTGGALAPKINKQETVKMKEIVCLDMTLYSMVITKALKEDIASIFQVRDISMC